MTAEPTQLFADMQFNDGVLMARLVGPNFGQREGPVVVSMIEAELEKAPARLIVLDCSDISFINSSGLGSCVVIHNRAKAIKGKAVLYALRKDLVDVFKMTRMDKLFVIAEDAKKLGKVLKRG